MSVRLYFCGETVVDLFEQGEGSGLFKQHLGGSLFHGATGAQRAVDRDKLDVKVGFVGPLSSDFFGNRFFQVLSDMKIDTSGVRRVDRNTTMAIVSIRPGKENDFAFYKNAGADEMTSIDDLPASLGEKGDSKIFCFGSISTVIEPARFAWLEFARRQREEGALVFYDLNTRPKIARDPIAYRAIVLDWARTAHIMKASDADIGWAYPGMSMREVADIWLNAGAHMAVFTKGMHGSEAYTKAASATADSLDLVAANTVGAGDNFNAGVAIHLGRRKICTAEALITLTADDMRYIIEGANRTAAYHLISIGAQPRGVAAASK